MDPLRSRLFQFWPPVLRQTWPFLLVMLIQGAIAVLSIGVLSSVRAFVAGESLWSKGQKDAIYHLERYAFNGDPKDYEAFRTHLAVPLSDRSARIELESDQPNMALVRQYLLGGGNHSDDVPGLIILLRHLNDWHLVRDPIEQWLIGDAHLDQLQALAREIRATLAQGPADTATRAAWSARLGALNDAIRPASRLFSERLGASSRQIVLLLLLVNIGTALLLIGITLMHNQRLIVLHNRAEDALRAERERARTTLAAIGDGVITTDPLGVVVYVNPATEMLLSRPAEHLLGRPLQEVLHISANEHLPAAQSLLQYVLQGMGSHQDNRTRDLHRPGRPDLQVKVVGSAIQDQGAVTGAVFVVHDVTREQHYLTQLSWQASHDALTGLANRREFERRLQELLPAARTGLLDACLLYVDLDQFKLINDTCGHQAGDEMLREVSRMLQSQLREGDTLARLGGDEFGVLLHSSNFGASMRIAERIRHGAEELRVRWGNRDLQTGMSIGLVQLTPHLQSLQEVLRVADMACYRAKEAGRNKVFPYHPEDQEMSRREDDMDWVRRLRKALEEDRFALYAQEIRPLQGQDDEGLHMELLLRLSDENGQLVPPGTFIPAAERYGMMPTIDRWVIKRAFDLLAQHQQSGRSPVVDTCAINLSGNSLSDDSLLAYLHAQMTRSGVLPTQLCFEITETSAIAHLPNAVHIIQELQQLGCRFALDDFGAGMSSFGYLKHLPVDFIKIDGSFVKEICTDPIHRAMVEAIHHIGHVMGKRTIAEFVETAEAIEILRSIGVDYGQGYAMAHPVALEQLLGAATPAARASAINAQVG
jgi:diguanylate cyclase (GGDEF)-like protein/PAS domain S-box-containing protein